MSPKEKAQQLFDLMFEEIDNKGMYDDLYRAKQCSLIAVDEILNVLPQQEYLEDRGEYSENREKIYWKEVKQEIEKK